MKRKHTKRIVAMIMMLALVLTMNIAAYADTVPVIDMGTFHNIYHAAASSADFEIGGLMMSLSGKTLEADEISFSVVQMDGEDFKNKLSGGFTTTVKNAADGEISFKPGSYTEAGKYYYTVSAIMPGPAYTTSTAPNKVTVTIIDDGGSLIPSASVAGSVFEITYTPPTDEWITDSWEHEVIEKSNKDYILLKKYTGNEKDLTIYGEAKADGKTCSVILGLEYDSGTGKYSSYLTGNTKVEKVTFVSVNGIQVKTELDGKANEMFKGCTALKTVDFNNSFGGKLTDISGMFEGCTALKTADLTGLDLSECKKAEKTFNGCTGVTSTKLTGVDLKKLTDASEMYSSCSNLTSIDLTEASWGNGLEDTAKMFNGAEKLEEIKVPADFKAGTTCTDMFKTSAEKKLLIKGSPSETFINRVCPTLKDSNRYLGEVSIRAAVSLSGNTLKADMFTCRLYRDSVVEANLIKTVKNDSTGRFDFGEFKLSDISKPVKYIAVQEEAEHMTNKTGNLTSETTIILNTDGSLKIRE